MRTLVIFTSGSTEAKKKKSRLISGSLYLPFFGHFTSTIRGRGGGVLNKFLYGEAPPEGPTPYPFKRKRYPFKIPSIDKWYPPLSHTLFRTLHPF